MDSLGPVEKAALASWLVDFNSWAEVLFPDTQFSRVAASQVYFWLVDQVRHYGIDGYGDKPSDMSCATYWLQHLDAPCGYRTMHYLEEWAADHRAPQPKAKAKAKAKAEPKARGRPRAKAIAAPRERSRSPAPP